MAGSWNRKLFKFQTGSRALTLCASFSFNGETVLSFWMPECDWLHQILLQLRRLGILLDIGFYPRWNCRVWIFLEMLYLIFEKFQLNLYKVPDNFEQTLHFPADGASMDEVVQDFLADVVVGGISTLLRTFISLVVR